MARRAGREGPKPALAERRRGVRSVSRPFPGYATDWGQYWAARIEDWLDSGVGKAHRGSVDLVFTSPPFPLRRKKSYGNLQGREYLAWLREVAVGLGDLLAERGSLVIELGNAWNKGEPTMSTLPVEALLAIKDAGGFHLCQEFICHNPARLPSPAEYVNRQRIRVKDSWTRVWWLSRTPRPKADNRNIQLPYSPAMKALLKKQDYNAGRRPSQHGVSPTGFLKNHGGSIPPSLLTQEALDHFGSMLVASNTASADPYQSWCRQHGVKPHPARMQPALARFFVSFLTEPGDLVLDPFGGSNTTGAVAEQEGRRWVTVESDEGNLEPSRARFPAARPQSRA